MKRKAEVTKTATSPSSKAVAVLVNSDQLFIPIHMPEIVKRTNVKAEKRIHAVKAENTRHPLLPHQQ